MYVCTYLLTYICMYIITIGVVRILFVAHCVQLSETKMVKVDVEYCGKCGSEWQCSSLKNFLQEHKPGTEVVCHKGRQGSFEVKIGDTLVHSKLQTLALPDYQSLLENVDKAEQGEPLIKAKEQPIENCIIT